MPTEIGSYEAQTHLPELLRKVRHGESFTITNRGQAIARLVPLNDANRATARQAVAEMSKFMRSHRVNGVDTKALIEEGRR